MAGWVGAGCVFMWRSKDNLGHFSPLPCESLGLNRGREVWQQAPPTARPWQLILRMARQAAEMQTRQQSLREGQGWGGLWVWMTAKLPRRLSGQVFNLELCWSQAFANNLHLLHLHWCLKPGLWNTVFSMVPLCLRLWFLTHLTQHWWEAPAQGANQ